MAKQETETNSQAISRQFRQTAGLPERKSDKPTDPAEPSELTVVDGPEGGLGNEEKAGKHKAPAKKTAAKKAPAKKTAAKK